MNRKLFGLLCMVTAFNMYAKKNISRNDKLLQKITLTDTIVKDSVKTWNIKGSNTMLFNQSIFKDWSAKGEGTVSVNIGLNYSIDYGKKNWVWDNKFFAFYGLVKTDISVFEKKTDDRFEWNSILGRKLKGKWYYSIFFNLKTQFTKGYNYTVGKKGGVKTRDEYTNFLSPGYFFFGYGFLWRKNSNMKINLGVITSRITVVDKSFTLPDEKYFGVKEGKNMLRELGFSLFGYYKFELMKNTSLENILNLFGDYLQDPLNVDIDYQLNVVLKINKYLAASIIFQTIYDDDSFKGFQTRQIFGAGLNYVF